MNQHYVPIVYLKNFSVKKKKDYYVNVYDKIDNRQFNTNIKNLCVERDLYTLPNDSKLSKDKYVIEKFFSQAVEPMYQRAYDILVNDNVGHITRLQRIEILIGLFQLYSRNPFLLKESLFSHRNNIEKLYSQAVSNKVNILEYHNNQYDLKANNLDSIIDDISGRTLNHFKEKNINGINELGSFHENSIIQVDKIRDNSVFLTGDRPIPQSDGLTNNLNPLLLSKEFYVPLNTKYCVTLYHDISKKQDRIYRTLIPNGSVASINDKIYKQSMRFIIGTKQAIDKYFEMSKFMESTDLNQMMDTIEQVIKLGPHPTEPDRSGNAREVLQQYVDIYKRNKTLTDEEFSSMKKYVKKISKKVIEDRIK